ncbi:recombinase family protein [Paenibacillus soyae]|uniref:Recombinase family protein n=1 Tax=Paenibacillus soyae TaxID=2969249 RepID=A0A9X2MRC6_9BACL|nr:recombinase family protein [Paenibacillus soyae]MCR2805404.1 recombinase family protein [Paenibacillus soyae]
MNKNRAALYLRVSTEEQKREGFSLAAQEEILKGYCESKEYQIYDIYDDGGYSGKDFNRPRMQQLLRDLREDKFDIVLAVAVDRISRNNLDVLTLVEKELHPRGKKLLISTCDIDSSTETGKMFISLLGTFAEYERRLIISRVKKGMDKRAREGKWNGGMMLGYDSFNGELIVNKEEAEIVREIFELRALGKGYKYIARTLNAKGKKTKGTALKPSGSFSINAVKTILENEKYIGNITWGKQRDWNNKRRSGKTEPAKVDGTHDAIIDRDLWGKVLLVNKINSEATVSKSNFKGEFILSGILRCPSCGAGTVMSKKKKRDGSGYHLYYMCQNYHAKGKTVCGSNLVIKELVEEQVIKFIRTMLDSEEIIDGIVDRLTLEEIYSTAQLEKDLNVQRVELKKLLDRQKKQDDDYYSGKIKAERYDRLAETLEGHISEAEQAISYIERELEKIRSTVFINKKIIIEALTNFENLFGEATNEEKRALLRALIREIHVEADRKSIKNIIFWFSEDDGFAQAALPVSEERGTVS